MNEVMTPADPRSNIVFEAYSVANGAADGHMLSVRFGLPSPAARRLHFEGPLAQHGLLLVTLRPRGRARPLVLVADIDGLGLVNEGASATNAAERIVEEFAPVLGDVHHCPEEDLEWVAMDSMGMFDRWMPNPFGVEFAPLRADASKSPPRTKEAFYDAFPGAASEMFLHVLRLVLQLEGESQASAVDRLLMQ